MVGDKVEPMLLGSSEAPAAKDGVASTATLTDVGTKLAWSRISECGEASCEAVAGGAARAGVAYLTLAAKLCQLVGCKVGGAEVQAVVVWLHNRGAVLT